MHAWSQPKADRILGQLSPGSTDRVGADRSSDSHITLFTFYWQNEYSRGHNFEKFACPTGVVPVYPNDERYLVLRPGGIHDSFGTPLGIEHGLSFSIAAISAYKLISLSLKDMLLSDVDGTLGIDLEKYDTWMDS